jgi:DNA-binding transcriptional LysR family regulator
MLVWGGDIHTARGKDALDLQLLRAFLAVAETGSVSAAADELGYSQPGLSHRVATLERELGCVLFRRRGKGMALTHEGQLLLPYARMTVMMIRDVNKAIADFQAAQDSVRSAKPPRTESEP